MKYFWCTKCNVSIQKNDRQKRVGTKGWVCPTCGIGLPRHPVEIINEDPEWEEVLSS